MLLALLFTLVIIETFIAVNGEYIENLIKINPLKVFTEFFNEVSNDNDGDKFLGVVFSFILLLILNAFVIFIGFLAYATMGLMVLLPLATLIVVILTTLVINGGK